MTFDPATLTELAIDSNVKRLRKLSEESITRNRLHAFFLIGNLLVFILVQIKVPEPYLDEIFHIPQTQRYCEEDFDSWDPAITTPPGLYLLTSIPLATLHIKCNPWLIRMTNLLFSTIIMPSLISSICSSLQSFPYTFTLSFSSRRQNRGSTGVLAHLLKPSMESIVISSFPLITFFGNLYYTDLGSLAGVLGCWALALKGRHYISAIIGAWSVTVRQTNIIWVAFILAISLLSRIQQEESKRNNDRKITVMRDEGMISSILQTLITGLSILPSLISLIIPYIPVFIGFLIFLIRNEGIVLGHKENHQPVLHGTQLFYFIAFTSISMFPTLLSEGIMPTIQHLWRFNTRSIAHFSNVVILRLVASAYVVKAQTVIHPFLLADNRHYTFYIFRWFILKYWWARYALVPFYLGAWQAWIWRIRHRASVLWLLCYLVCCAATLVPTPLVEPRYFLIPTIILRIQLTTPSSHLSKQPSNDEIANKEKTKFDRIPDPQKPASARMSMEANVEGDNIMSQIVEFGWYTIINAFTIGLFLWKEFEWDGWEGKMRFMW